MMLLTLICLFLGNHAIYLSTCEIVIERDRIWHGSIRIFFDDFEDAIQNETGVRPNLAAQQLSLFRHLIAAYLDERLIITQEDKLLTYSITALSRREDVVEILISGNEKWLDHSYAIKNSILTELFESQKNVMTITAPSGIETLLFNKRSILQGIDGGQ